MPTGIGTFIADVGHNLGLPEFGISEALGGFDNRPGSPAQRGFSTNSSVKVPGQADPVPTYVTKPGSYQTVQRRNIGPAPTAPTPTGGGGGGNSQGGGITPDGTYSAGYHGSSAPNNDEINRQISDTFNSSNDYLNQAEGQVRADYPTVQNDINSQFGVNTAQLNTGHQANVNTLNQTQDKTDYAHESALAAARRLYSELRQGYQQRFGGSSSAGEAANEYANVEQQRQMGQTNRGYQEAGVQIGNSRLNEGKEHENSLQALTVQKDTALNQANRDFQNKLLQISQNRAANEQAKGQAKLQALQDLRNQVFQINQQTTQFAQSLEAQRAGGQLALGNFGTSTAQHVQNAQGAAQGYGQQAAQRPTSNLQAGGAGQAPAQQPSYVGAISNRGKDQYGNPL